jgi:hypothetical protein
MFFYADNLTTQTVKPGDPWSFVSTARITPQIRADKEDRQRFYQDPETRHSFYTGIEGVNNTMRPGKDNPPHKIHAFCADYDAKIPVDRVKEAIEAMAIRPAWIERSLGGNVRLVWTLAQPILVDDYSLCAFILASAVKWLQLELLPALDEPAFTTPSRLLCNGCEWEATGHPEIPIFALQAFFVDVARKYRFSPSSDREIPLDIVEAACREKYPAFDWPGEFMPESQGPTFWIPESASPLSAIVKPTGMFTFSAHATKSFYPWSDILGAEFVKDFAQTSITKATLNVFWDSKRFWRKIKGQFNGAGKEELLTYFKVDCGLSAKAGKSGASPIELALNHIYTENRIQAAVPFVFRPSGLIDFMGKRMLNTYMGVVIPPAEGTQVWGPQGSFPFLSNYFDNFLNPAEQLPRLLAWAQYYYQSAFEQVPLPGQNIFLMGGAGVGKTLFNRNVIGTAVGGYVDASDYLLNGSTFNSHLLNAPHWCMDDDTPSHSAMAVAKLQAMFKKTAANQQVLSNQKFEVSGMTEWMGRIGCTTNLDAVSIRTVGPLDNSSLDKTCLFRCESKSKIAFPSRVETARLITTELPFFLRWLLDWKVPDEIERDSRYGFVSYQDPLLLDKTHQSSPAAPFKELLIDTLYSWFKSNEQVTEWTGTVSQLMKMIAADFSNEPIMRSIRMDSVARYLEQIQKEGLFACSTSTGPMNTRIWKFSKPEEIHTSSNPDPAQAQPVTVPIFSAPSQ